MKNIILFFALGIAVFIAGCGEEIPPQIESCNTDRIVLVEKFTGIECGGCPEGSRTLKRIVSQPENINKVITVTIHSGFYAINYNGFELHCTDGMYLEKDHLGPAPNFPRAAIDRMLFPNENELPYKSEQWAGFIADELCQRPIGTLSLSSTFDENTRELSVTTDVIPSPWYNEVLPEDLALTVMITEDNIIGYQKDNKELSGYNASYVHKDVLRDVISTDVKGDLLINKGQAFTATQKLIGNYTLPNDWNADECNIVAFIHYKGSAKSGRQVLQAAKIDLK